MRDITITGSTDIRIEVGESVRLIGAAHFQNKSNYSCFWDTKAFVGQAGGYECMGKDFVVFDKDGGVRDVFIKPDLQRPITLIANSEFL